MMTKKDFVALADALRDSGATVDVQEAVAWVCSSANGAFKKDRWLSYIRGECGPNGGKLKEVR